VFSGWIEVKLNPCAGNLPILQCDFQTRIAAIAYIGNAVIRVTN